MSTTDDDYQTFTVEDDALPSAPADPALEALPAPAGTPLSALASVEDVEDQAAAAGALERLHGVVTFEDGSSIEVTVGNRDFVAWDLVRAKRKWPAASEAPFLLNTFLAFAAAKRSGAYLGTFETFEAAVDFVKMERGDAAPPTR